MLAAASLALLAGCTPAPAAAPAPSEAGGAAGTGPLVVTLQVTAAADRVGMQLQVTNASSAPVALHFNSGQIADFAVNEGERRLWTWSADRSFIQSLQTRTLAPGETLSESALWTPPAGLAGHALTATAWLRSSSHPAERTQAFRLP